jgi:type I restriction enzyme M protein
MPRGKVAPSNGKASKTKTSVAAKAAKAKTNGTGANLGFEKELFETANGLRGNVDPAEYKHIVLGLIFLKYISDIFEEHQAKVKTIPGADPEDRDEYKGDNVFWVPQSARWADIQAKAKSPKIGVLIDEAMVAIESENPADLRGVLPKDYANPKLDPARLGKLIDVISTVGFTRDDKGSKDILGRVYEYFLKEFAGQEGKQAGEFYTPRCIVRMLVEMIEPFKGRIFDPCCGSGGMFVQSEEFLLEHEGRVGDLVIYGQESNHTTWRLAKMNMAIRGIDADIRWNPQGSFIKDAFPDLKADFILANPQFNDSEWSGELLRDDKRWKYGVPPVGNANFAWVQHFIVHLSVTGVAAFLLANGAMSSNQGGEGEIRKALIEANLVDCIVALPGQLFYGTQIPVSAWIISRDRQNHKFRDRRDEVLFIDARKIGEMVDRTHKELLKNDNEKIAGVYHAWRSKSKTYSDIVGFCKSVSLEEIQRHGFILAPGRYVGTEDTEERGEEFAYKMRGLVAQLSQQRKVSVELDGVIADCLKAMGYGI